MEVKPIKEWGEKSGAFPSGTVCIYIGNTLIGHCVPTRNMIDCYTFDSLFDSHVINVPTRINLTIDEIKHNIELSLKEFHKKMYKS